MINTHKLELPLARTYFHGPKGVRAIEVLLCMTSKGCTCAFFSFSNEQSYHFRRICHKFYLGMTTA